MQEAQEVNIYYWDKNATPYMYARVFFAVRTGEIWSFSMICDPENWNVEMHNVRSEVLDN